MKAKHIKKLRQQLQYYDIWVSPFFTFGFPDRYTKKYKADCTLLARSPQEACKRANKKGLLSGYQFQELESSSYFARFIVAPQGKVSERFTSYWK